MANWRSPGRAERLVIYQEGGELCQYWRAEDDDGNVMWHKESPDGATRGSADAMTTTELLRAVESSLHERRRASRGRKFRL
ncbi:MAG TPA: hypothetical protein VNZ01_15235 [Solirubrobacteraceae bacterium]|jgi:hypothetical protein|nr:hypothetical protein [Solirubrobacteraceae bacterium]